MWGASIVFLSQYSPPLERDTTRVLPYALAVLLVNFDRIIGAAVPKKKNVLNGHRFYALNIHEIFFR